MSAVKSLNRALDIVEALSKSGGSATVTHLAAELGIPKSGVFRSLDTLRQRGYVQQDEASSRYSLGTGFLAIARSIDTGSDLRSIASPHLLWLRDEAGETVHLAVPSGRDMVYIDKFDSGQPVGMASFVGQRLPLHSTSLGKAYLAHLEEEERGRLLSEISLYRRTERTIVDSRTLSDELAKVKERGYAIDNIENEDGVRCVGAPIKNCSGESVAAISVAAPAYRFSEETAREVGTYCIEAAKRIQP